MGFKVGFPEYIPGEKDWVYGVLVNGKLAQAGDRIPNDAVIVLQVGDGTRNANDTTNQRPGSRYEEIEVEEPKYEEYYDWVEVPVDENGNEIKEGGKSAPQTLPSVPPQSQALPPGQNTPKPTE